MSKGPNFREKIQQQKTTFFILNNDLIYSLTSLAMFYISNRTMIGVRFVHRLQKKLFTDIEIVRLQKTNLLRYRQR
jgi:hypothetical protein